MNISMPNKERYIVDSNIFYALFVSDDTLHDDAMALFAIIDTAELIVTYGVIQEVTTLLTYRKGKKIADGFVQHLLDAGNVMLFS
jgi:predicted nucleic acid-binding protein